MSLLFCAIEKKEFHLYWEHPYDRVWCSLYLQYVGLSRPHSVATKQKRNEERVAEVPLQPW